MENRETAFYKGDKLNRILELNPRLRAMESNDIEEIILYSGRKDNDENMCISCKCNGFTMQSGQLNLSVCQKEPQDISSGNIRKALYAYWKQTGQLKDNEFMPDITLVEDYPTYTRIKISQSRSVAMDRSWMGNVEEYKKNNEWNNIIAMIPDWDIHLYPNSWN